MKYMAMSKIKSSDQLLDYMDENLKNRKREISFLKLQLQEKVRKKSKEVGVLSKSLILISYSHYEGFVKDSSVKFFEYLNFKGLKCKDVTKGLVAAYIHASLYSNPLSATASMEKILDFISNDENKIIFNPKYMSDAESNLNSEILEKITKRMDMHFFELDANRTFIDSVILKYRNDFAHGDWIYVDTDRALEISNKVVLLLDSFSNELQNIIVQKKYLR